MNISTQDKTITCDCGQTLSIQDAELYFISNCEYHFHCSRCQAELVIPVIFNDFFKNEIEINVQAKTGDHQCQEPSDIGDIFLGQNQVPLTDELIDRLVKEEGMNKNDLKHMQKEGAQYSTTRKSFIFPADGDLDIF